MNGSSSFVRVTRGLVPIALFGGVLLGCRASPSGGGPGSGPRPALVSIAATAIQSGFGKGLLRKWRTMSPYEIMKYPVTWADYDACERSGACRQPDASECIEASQGAFRVNANASQRIRGQPATCVGETQADAYCHWIGGRLPTLDEWLLAARGGSPQRYAWGDAPPNCDQHPLKSMSAQGIAPEIGKTVPCPNADAGLTVGQHPAGASAAGLQDVLLTPGELLAPDSSGIFNACANGSGHCVVFGKEPAAIDGVQPFYRGAATKEGAGDRAGAVVGHLYSFRCAFDASQGSGQ